MLPNPHHIIALGASAGGLEELNLFFDCTPLDSVSYVIVQHLSPDFKSRMVEIIARHSKLEVKEAGNEMPVESNKVYVIPHDKFMTISDNKFHLTDKDKVKGPHLTVDTFFNSLATDSGKKAIGIILSGMGADGSIGIKAIKKAGGMVIARDPETTEFPSMPSNAIKTGVIDFILEPELMPDAIEDYVKDTTAFAAQNEEDKKTFTAITDLIKEQSPLDFSDYKQATILRRIKRRAEYNNCKTLNNYFDLLKNNPEEIEVLCKEFLISVTSFFRDKEAFKLLQTDILPDIIKRLHPDEELKIWIAGCATGEEAYSMAILICEQLTGDAKDIVVKIFATDIDNTALAHAGKGIYNADITKHISPERIEKHFIKEGDKYRVTSELRNLVIFAKHDIVKNPPYCNMQLISCRNLLIYMTPALQKKIFLMLQFGLKVNGYLFLGPSENPLSIIQNLETVNEKWKIYKNIASKRLVRFDAFSLPELADIKVTPPRFSPENTNNTTLDEAVNLNLVDQLDYLVVCIDENNHVVKTYGDTGKFLLQKNFNLNLVELLPRQLAVAFNALSITALKTNEKAAVSGIKINNGDTEINVSLSVSPMVIKKSEQKMLMVTFSEDTLVNNAHQEAKIFNEENYFDEYTSNLEEELKEVKDKLHDTYLKLDASNENMQSFNEELLSTNEEMQSTNEEMQSVNEELHTINTDYQLKNKELQEINDDLNNYFRSNINGQLFVNNDLILMKFSPGTVKQINLLPSDVGRPLSNISTNIKFETIIDDIKKVISEGSIITKEIETNNGKWYQIMSMPYILADNTTSGAIITFNDITEIKKTQLELDKKNISLLNINADLDNFVHTTSHDLLAPLANIEMSIDVMNQIKVVDPTLNKFLTVINSSIKKFRSLINDIATVAKVESGMLSTEMINLGEIINEIEWSLENKIKSTGTIIKRGLEVKQIRFSKKNLRSILFNLISNSIKFKGKDRPVINISTSKEKDNIILSVQDNGIGISKDDCDKIFEMYGRVNYDIDGHGIGLYLAKKIVDAAGGNIVVESEIGKGCKFTLYLNAEPELAIAAHSLN